MYAPCGCQADRRTRPKHVPYRGRFLSHRITPLTRYSLTDLGWSDHFARQRKDVDAHLIPARISEVHRSQLVALSESGEHRLIPADSAGAYAVGDWVLTDGTRPRCNGSIPSRTCTAARRATPSATSASRPMSIRLASSPAATQISTSRASNAILPWHWRRTRCRW